MEFLAAGGGIRFAMTGIKGVGTSVVELILEERKKGPFTSLYDFVRRIDKTKVGKKQIELLIEAGSFDFTKWSRDAMLQSMEAMYEETSQSQKEAQRGVISLFSLIDQPVHFQDAIAPAREGAAWFLFDGASNGQLSQGARFALLRSFQRIRKSVRWRLCPRCICR
jgi:DNA polymerase III alpha subunit